jgi:hypothetical protein
MDIFDLNLVARFNDNQPVNGSQQGRRTEDTSGRYDNK